MHQERREGADFGTYCAGRGRETHPMEMPGIGGG